MHKTIFPDTKPVLRLLALLAMFVGMLLVASGLMVLMPQSSVDLANTRTLLWMQCFSQLLTFLVPVVLFVLFYESDTKSFLKADFSGGSWLQALAAMAIVLLIEPAVDLVTQWNDGWHFAEPVEGILREINERSQGIIESFLADASVTGLLLNILIIALVPAVCEELFFRCVVQQTVHKWLKNPHVAVLLTAIIFSMAHGEVYAFVPRVVLGMALGYLFYYGRSVVVNISAHFLNNAIVVLVYFLYHRDVIGFKPDELPSIAWPWILASLLAAGFLFYVTFLRKEK